MLKNLPKNIQKNPPGVGTYERSAGAVVFYVGGEERLYLLMRYKSKTGGHWEFPRGHIEAGEREQQTALREIREETGLMKLAFLPTFREVTRFYFKNSTGVTITKDAIFYLARAKTLKIGTSEEHRGFAWLPYSIAREHIKFPIGKKVLDRAEQYLTAHYR